MALDVARSVLGAAERDVVAPLEGTLETETHILDAVTAIRNATASIEQHVEVIDTLANSVAPLGASVDRLTDTMHELVALLGPMGSAERGIHNVERFFGRHRHKEPAQRSDGQNGATQT
jgi:uncharacterized protein YoxC